MAHSLMVCSLDVHQLAAIVRNRIDNALILDSRSFLEYNASHVVNAINVGCAKLMKRRLQQEKLCIEDFLSQSCHWDVGRGVDIIVYDQSTRDARSLPPDSFMAVFLSKLLPKYNSVSILRGGFLEFQAAYPSLCEDERAKCGPMTSLSQPCLPVSNHGPTRILPFMYLGSQNDALNKEVLQHHNITYHLNVSTNCPKPDFIQDSHFMRIPVIDNYSEKLLPHFPKAFQFLDKVKESGGCVLVHCLAGISRSATVAISYVMKSLKMTSDEAYRYVKAKRPTISPNFNFLGQLLEYEKQLQADLILGLKSETSTAPMFNTSSLSYEQRCRKISEETTDLYSQTLMPDSYCVKYGDVAEMTSSSTCIEASKTTECLVTCEQTVKLVSIPEKQLNIKCLPVSSLRELSFTPCQTSSFKTTVNAEKKLTKCLVTSPTKTVTTSFTSAKSADKNYYTEIRLVDCKKVDSGLESLKTFDCDSKPYNRSDSYNQSSDTYNRPDSYSRSDSYNQSDLYNRADTYNRSDSYNRSNSYNRSDSSCSRSELYNRSDSSCNRSDLFNRSDSSCNRSDSYNRSDSVSTSGLGSEGSDYADSWNEYTSSCERETDILMDDDYPLVPSVEEDVNRNKRVGCFEDSYEDSLSMYTKYEPQYGTCRSQARVYLQAVPTDNAKKYSWKHQDPYKPDTQPLSSELYRAQSCPGMLSSETSSHDTFATSDTGVKLRRSKLAKSGNENTAKNRYSCSSIDYRDYNNAGLSRESCPNASDLDSRSDGGKKYASHCSYRHSMIQVS